MRSGILAVLTPNMDRCPHNISGQTFTASLTIVAHVAPTCIATTADLVSRQRHMPQTNATGSFSLLVLENTVKCKNSALEHDDRSNPRHFQGASSPPLLQTIRQYCHLKKHMTALIRYFTARSDNGQQGKQARSTNTPNVVGHLRARLTRL